MELFSSLMSSFAALIAGGLVIIHLLLGSASSLLTSLSSSIETYQNPGTSISTSTPTTSSSTPAIVASSTSETAIATTTATPTKKTTAKKPVATQTAAMAPVVKAPLAPIVPAEQVNEIARASIVNILCVAQEAGEVRSISGSGVIIDSRGVVLTNAHIGQYFLLRDYPFKNAIDCVIRTGSPASPMYRATLLYLPPAWISANASQITAAQGTGTGENDYAFLRITSTTNPQGALPSSFPNIAMSSASPDTGDSALVAGYPAGFLDAQTIEKNLYATSAFTQIGQLYTFDVDTHIDVVSLGGTVVSQGGSSGGAVVRNYDGKLVGLIATATAGTSTASRDLRAITIGYIDRSLGDAGKGGIVSLLSDNLSTIENNFASTFAEEKKQLIDVISR